MVITPLLEIRNLHVGYKTHMGISKVLNGVYLTVNEGEKVGVIGESGCGKTTTMKSIHRILPGNAIVSEGEIIFKGKDILKMKKRELTEIRRKGVTMIFQDPTAALNPVFKVSEMMTDIIKYSGIYEKNLKKEARNRALDLFEEVALSDPERVFDSYSFQLSGGMRQRVCIAMSLAGVKQLVIADEPTTNLDVTIQAQVLSLLKSLVNEKRLSLILVSQALGAVRETADRVYVMYAGDIVEVAKADVLFTDPLHPYTQKLLDSVPRLTGGVFSIGIKGRVPNYFNPPSGCRFYPRCDQSLNICKDKKSPLVEVKKDHCVACWLYRGVST
ncbi:MAG TPA: ABC transporter ATP-binding protein [Thermoplasmata archaeon]|nr:ABC transporter ATP-binding protein [Thermoplasmata archaeon]